MISERPQQFDSLLTLHYKKFFKGLVSRYSRKGARDIGEDIVQEAYTRALERWEEYKDEFAFATWFETKILPGERINHRRREQKHTQAAPLEFDERLEASVDQGRISNGSTPEQVVYTQELLQIIADKDDDVREVLHDALILGDDYVAIGHRVRKSANAIEMIVRRFRKEMQNDGKRDDKPTSSASFRRHSKG
jgi:RNA polymerase sigma factor (sigma-70 family)